MNKPPKYRTQFAINALRRRTAQQLARTESLATLVALRSDEISRNKKGGDEFTKIFFDALQDAIYILEHPEVAEVA